MEWYSIEVILGTEYSAIAILLKFGFEDAGFMGLGFNKALGFKGLSCFSYSQIGFH